MTKSEIDLLIKTCERIRTVRDLNFFFGNASNVAKIMTDLAVIVKEGREEIEFLTACYDHMYDKETDT